MLWQKSLSFSRILGIIAPLCQWINMEIWNNLCYIKDTARNYIKKTRISIKKENIILSCFC